jgi:hypothetical protein
MTAKPKIGFVGRRGFVWWWIASWFVPAMMTTAYFIFALTSEADTSGWIWMSLGLGFVLCLWWMFRVLTRSAAMARAIAVGDTERIVEIDPSPLYAGIAHELDGKWADALRDVARVTSTKPRERSLAAVVKIGALVETGEVAKARTVLDTELAPPLAKVDARLDAQVHLLASLARGRVLAAERANAEARQVLHKVIADIRTGARARAIAHHYAARAAAADGDHAAADRHRAKAAELAPGTWIAG